MRERCGLIGEVVETAVTGCVWEHSPNFNYKHVYVQMVLQSSLRRSSQKEKPYQQSGSQSETSSTAVGGVKENGRISATCIYTNDFIEGSTSDQSLATWLEILDQNKPSFRRLSYIFHLDRSQRWKQNDCPEKYAFNQSMLNSKQIVVSGKQYRESPLFQKVIFFFRVIIRKLLSIILKKMQSPFSHVSCLSGSFRKKGIFT